MVLKMLPDELHAYAQVTAQSGPLDQIVMSSWLVFHGALSKFPVGIKLKGSMNQLGMRCPELMARYIGFTSGGTYNQLDFNHENFKLALQHYYSSLADEESCVGSVIGAKVRKLADIECEHGMTALVSCQGFVYGAEKAK